MTTPLTAFYAGTARAQYCARLSELREAAEHEGIAWKEVSERDFKDFVAENFSWRKAGLALMDNGNLRAVWEWESDDEAHPALQFLGNKLA